MLSVLVDFKRSELLVAYMYHYQCECPLMYEKSLGRGRRVLRTKTDEDTEQPAVLLWMGAVARSFGSPRQSQGILPYPGSCTKWRALNVTGK